MSSSASDDQASHTPTTLQDVLKQITVLKNIYPSQTDFVLNQLNLYSAPSEQEETVPETGWAMMQQAIDSTCTHIVDNHFPCVDDACELFLIQAQAAVRFGTWYDYPIALKYLSFSERCGPNPVQRQRIESIRTVALGYKLKSTIESTLWNVAKTWLAYNSFLVFTNFLFPFSFTEREIKEFGRLDLGYSADGTYRDLTPYLESPTMPRELLSTEQEQFSQRVESMSKSQPIQLRWNHPEPPQ